MAETANAIWDDGPVDSPYQPEKSRIRAWGTWVETFLAAIGTNGGFVYTSRALLFADLSKPDKTMAWVISDPVAANNGIYQKVGAANSGSWVRVGDLPYSFIIGIDIGAGTPNAIQVSTTIPISESALVWFPLFEPNGPGPVTVSFNGDTPLTVKTNSGNDPVDQGLVGVLLGIKIGSTFQLLTDQASAAIQAAAEAAAVAAAGYAALARNDVVVNPFTGDGTTTDFTLTVDPGSAANMRVNMNGAVQLHSSYSLVYVSTIPKIRFSEAPPDGVAFEVEMGFRIAVGAPAAGSVTYDKIQNITAALRLLGRDGSGAGQVQELTAAQVRDLFLPTGSVIQTARATYATNATLTTAIPMDDTVPQNTEGTEILTLTITPSSTTSKLRIRWEGQGAAQTANAQMIWAIFKSGQANALAAGFVNADVVNAGYQMAGGAEFVPGSTSAVTISVRVGTNGSGATMRMNGTTAARFMGGVSAAELVVDEIKA